MYEGVFSVAVLQDMPLDQLMVDDKHTKVVGGPQSYELFMEIRAEGEVFKVYKKGGKYTSLV